MNNECEIPTTTTMDTKLIDTKENKINSQNFKNTKELNEQIVMNYLNRLKNPFVTISVQDVSKDLHIGINQAYDLFKQEDFPTITIGKRKTITLAAYLLWKMSKKEV